MANRKSGQVKPYQLPKASQTFRMVATIAVVAIISACGGGSSGGFTGVGGGNNGGSGGGTGSDWTPGVFLQASTFQSRCAAPRAGTNDIQGTTADENNFLRSYSDDTYLWYAEIVDRDPSLFSTPDYFDGLRTDALTPSGNFKDNFHFDLPTDEWIALSQSGTSAGYGAQFALLQTTTPRLAVVAYTDPNTPATAANLARGAEILTVDGEDVIDSSNVDVLNAGLFPESAGEIHEFTVRDLDQTVRTFTMQSAIITSAPVQNVSTIPSASGDVGYLLFNDHIATAESGLFDAITQLAADDITDLVIDVRYNGGGFLDIASEFAYMIAGSTPTAGQTFEEITFNDKHPATDPVTGQPLTPILFHTLSLGFSPSLLAGNVPLPTLNLPRVYVLTGSGTCSASESIINSLRGVDVDVIQIGSSTCGKPYGFYATGNCGTTYFTIQFQGVNAKGFGDYADGFSPANTPVGEAGTLVPGCSVGDDFTAALGDPVEARLAAALNHRDTGLCPAASGLTMPGLSKPRLLADDRVVTPKTPWQQNRILRR